MTRPRALVLIGLLLALAVPASFWLAADSRAEDGSGRSVFLHITGSGPTARAWYKGAAPAGVPVQDALDRFSADGYRVAHVTDITLPSFTLVMSDGGVSSQVPSGVEPFYVVMLEKR
jgi:hypothetical protein